MSDKRNKQDAKRSDKDRCRSAKAKEGLRKLQALVSRTEAVVNRLADLDDDLVTKATVIASVARQRGRNGGKSVSPTSKSSLSSEETLQETSRHESSSENAVTLQDREGSQKVKGDKSYVDLETTAKGVTNKNGVSTEDANSSQKTDDNTKTNNSQSQLENHVETTNVSTIVDGSKTHSAGGNSSKVNQPETKAQENLSDSDIKTPNVPKPNENGETIDTEASPLSTTVRLDDEADKVVSDVTVSHQRDVTPATGKKTPDLALGQQFSTNSPPLAPSPTTVSHDHANEEEISAKQSASTPINIEGQQELNAQIDPDEDVEEESVKVCTAIAKAEGIINDEELPEDKNSPRAVSPAEVDGDSPIPDAFSNQHPPQIQPSATAKTLNTDQQPSQETPTNEQSASANPPKTNEKQAAKIPTNQQPSQETSSNEQSASANPPKTNDKQAAKIPTNQQPSQETPTNEQLASANPPKTNEKQAAKIPTNQQPSQETSSNEQSVTRKAPKANQQQRPKNPSNQQNPPKTQTNQQSKSTKAPSTNKKPTPKIQTNEKSSPADNIATNQESSPSTLTKKKSPSTSSLTQKQNSSSKTAKKQSRSTTALPKIQYPALKKQVQKPPTSTETQSTNQQSLPKISTKKQSTSTDTVVSNTQPPQKNIASNLSQPTKSQEVDQQSRSEDVLTKKATGSPRSPRSSFPVITYQHTRSSIAKSPSPTPSNQLSPSISQASPSTTPSNQRLLSPKPSNQEPSITPVPTNQEPPSPTAKVQLLSVDQSGDNVKPVSRPSTGSSSIALSSSNPSLGPSIGKEDPPDGTKQNGVGPESSPGQQRHKSKAKDDVRKKLQGKLRQRRGQRV
ncbi:Hypp9075 [Branchiostoma lanceolatum]|uniref:Hypp9075 protein n=1 Tax=Branchiostoma lanceolatum TaxID=7740 RepID=A0A8J9ZD60_BRALA|nr:Hypp9075 [Branchiostoma lanceolatum]